MYNDPFGGAYGRQRHQELIRAAQQRHQANAFIKAQNSNRVRKTFLTIINLLGL